MSAPTAPASQDALVSPGEDQAPERRRLRPVVGWAALGFLWGGTALYVFAAWLLSGDAQSAPVGPDDVPRRTEVAAVLFQITNPLLAALMVARVVRACVRERRLVLDAMIVIATTLAWWHDPLINWLRPNVFYSAVLVDRGSWTEQVPGWISPNARFLPEPVFMIGCVYVWMSLSCAILACTAMRRARARWPQLGALGTFGAGYVAVLALELPMELIAVHSGLVGYPAGFPPLTFDAGSTTQLPVYGPLLWTAVLTSLGWLRFSQDADGRTYVERGVDRLQLGRRLRTTVCLLAVTGYIHTVAIVGYDLPMNIAGLYAGPVEEYPSHLRTAQCGDLAPEPVECPGPDVPVRLDTRP